jgi:hypothetical protein
MTHKAVDLLAFTLAQAADSGAREIRRGSTDLAVRILDADGEAGRPQLMISHRLSGRSAIVELTHRFMHKAVSYYQVISRY